MFAKTPKLNKSSQDIEQNHGDTVKNGEPVSKEGLRNKLHASLEHLKDLGIDVQSHISPNTPHSIAQDGLEIAIKFLSSNFSQNK